MEISVLRKFEYVSSSGVIETVPLYDYTVNRTFIKGEVLRSENNIYIRTGNNLTPTEYNAGNESNYSLNQIIWKDNQLQYVSTLANTTVRKQPEDYSVTPPSDMNMSTWDHRYIHIGALDTSTNTWESQPISDVKHRLYQNGDKWIYEVSVSNGEYYWGEEQYDGPPNGSRYWRSDGEGTDIYWDVKYDGNIIYYEYYGYHPTPYVTIISASGNKYRCGQLEVEYDDAGGVGKLYGIQKQELRYVWTVISSIEVDVYDEASDENTENKTYCVDTSNCNYRWTPRTIIKRGNTLYIRSNTDNSVETETTTAVNYDILDTLTKADGWGWTYDRPSNTWAPFDGKKYTFISAPNTITYTIDGTEYFDTIAINGLISDEVTFTIVPDEGTAIDDIVLRPNTHIDINENLPAAPTTMICYTPRAITGTVTITFTPKNNTVRIGGIYTGLSANAGFTNLMFTNKFRDYSPYEKDQWGNIVYIKGVSTNIYIGTVDILLKNYDMTNRLMKYLGTETVILNGSDNKDNINVDSLHFFSSTMLIGRIRNFTLKTKLNNKLMSQMATYNFEIEEDI